MNVGMGGYFSIHFFKCTSEHRASKTLVLVHHILFKGIVIDSNICLWHESKDINKTKQNKKQTNKHYFRNFSWFQFNFYKLCMIMCIGIAP